MPPRFRRIRMLRRRSRAPAPDDERRRRALLWLALVTLVATAVYFATRDRPRQPLERAPGAADDRQATR